MLTGLCHILNSKTSRVNAFSVERLILGLFMGSKVLCELQALDIQQWIGELKKTMPAKTLSRKVSAIGNYFRWLDAEKALARNPAYGIRAPRVTAPLSDMLYENECERLLAGASSDLRTYLLVLLLLETGIKKAELLDLRTANLDFSNNYQPELWVKHTGKQIFKDRKLKLPGHIASVR